MRKSKMQIESEARTDAVLRQLEQARIKIDKQLSEILTHL